MTKIALVNPSRNRAYATVPPLNLGFLAACLEYKNHEVIIIDELLGQKVLSEIMSFNPDIVGITGVTPLIPDAYRIADRCRDFGYKTIIGGVHASTLPEEAIKHADIVLVGEGERTLREIINKNIKGIIKGNPVKDLNDIPFPAWHLMDMKYYTTYRQRVEMSFLSFASKNSLVGSILSSRGCPYSCTFCRNSFKDLPYRFNSPKRVIEEIEALQNAYGIDSLFFIEDNFFCNHPRVKKICKLIIKENIELIWGANSRVDNINKNILKLAKSAGCKQVTFGFESGSQKILDILNKLTTVEQNVKAVKLCNEVGVLANGTIMIGNPTETEEDLDKTREFILNNNIDGGIGICLTTPFPGTVLWDWCKENNRIPDKFWWSDFDYHTIPIRVSDIPNERLLEINKELVRICIEKYRRSI